MQKRIDAVIKYIVNTALTNVLESLFASLFFWYGLLALLPPTVAYSSLFEFLDVYSGYARYFAAVLFFVLSIATAYGVHRSIVWLRVAMLFTTSCICIMYVSVLVVSSQRIAGAAGALFILAMLSNITAWQIIRVHGARRRGTNA